MRRFRLIAWVLIAALLLSWVPGLPPIPMEVASAQTPAVTVIGPAGTLYYSTASVILSNAATGGVNLFSIVIPGAMFATQAAANTTSTMVPGQPTLGPLNSSIPLHLQIGGVLDTGATPGTINVGVNYGVGTQAAVASGPATITLANAVTPTVSLVGTPFLLDVYLSPIATGNMTNLASAGNATPNIVNTVFMHGRLEYVSVGTPASAMILNAATVANVNTASAHILNVLWGFGSAGPNYLRVYRIILKQGI
ncbi:MAG: hypothetical protein E6J01_03980 [Chloroflexi bacterium]|nr:MAG: hypothetical protein E6J01_03980 [Chloroflexota bacterium]